MHANALRRSPRPRAFTLIEILVSMTITLIMMGAVVSLFQIMADSVSGSRALLEMSDRLRGCRNRIQRDLQGATATMLPPLRPENDEGYFELIEGTATDNTGTLFGDTDDALLFTVRSRGEPFVGKYNGTTTVESQVAEVAYFLAQSGTESILDARTIPPTRLYTLYRRVMLIRPDIVSFTGPAVTTVYDNNDISVRFEQTAPIPPPVYTAFCNTLGDLTKRENRFAHFGVTLPSAFPFNVFVPTTSLPNPTGWPAGNLPTYLTNNIHLSPLLSARLGDDVLMTNVLAFDVQVWDPGAPVFVTTTTPVVSVEPRDAGYASLIGSATPTSYGAYADLGYKPSGYTGTNPPPLFNGAPNPMSTIGPVVRPYVYDTWSLHYENDGIATDAGTNGLDDGGILGVVDDLGEYDTLPPYPAPLRGVRVVVRVYEPSSQQVREVTIIQDFLPE